MRIEIILKDAAGKILDYQEGDALQPKQFRTHPDRPMREGKFALFGYTWQPITTVVLERSSPETGQAVLGGGD